MGMGDSSETSAQHLCLVNFVGSEEDGRYRYEFVFTEDVENVFGENFEYKPSCMVNDLNVGDEFISQVLVARTKNKINLIQDNCCFSISDAYDGILAIAWSECENGAMVLNFGDDIAAVEGKLADNNIIFDTPHDNG